MEIRENLIKIESQIKSLYTKTCIFSHNINEIMFHPLMFFSLSVFLPFYKKQFNSKPNKEIEDIVEANTIPKRFHNLRNFEIQNIYNPADVGMKKIYNLLLEYAKKKGIYGNCCYLSEYKTEPCKLVFQPNNYDYYIHMKKCPFFHSKLEKRRINKILGNDICKDAIKDGKWIVNDEEKINCSKGEYCNKYHTRNELFFDERNYRKLYPCTNNYCDKGALCPRKHPIDIKIDEIYLTWNEKEKLERDLKKLIEKNKKIQNREKKLSKIQCRSCLNYIDGEDGRNLYYIKICTHIICSKCYDFFKLCPLCGIRNNNYNDEDEKIYIKLDYEFVKHNDNNYEEENEEEGENEEKEDEEDRSGNDNDLKDPEDNDDEDKKKHSFNFLICDEVVYDTDNEDDNELENSMVKEIKKGKKNNNKNDNSENREDDKNDYSSSYHNSKGGRGRNLEKRGEKGKTRVRGKRGGRGNYSNNYYDNNDEDNYSNYNKSRRGKGYKRGGSKRGDNSNDIERNNNEKELNESDKNVSKQSDSYQEEDISMANNFQEKGKVNKTGRGVIRGRGNQRGRGRDNRKEEDSKSSSDNEDEDNNNSMIKNKNISNNLNDEESD